MTASSRRNDLIPPSLAWLTVFIPALSYFLATRFHSGHSSYPTVTSRVHVDSSLLGSNDVFFLSSHDSNLQHPLHLLEDSLNEVVASVWKHDSELGRGYLLISQAHGVGRIWRWERGGGPIPIGKTLAMDPSGCRSKSECIGGGSGGLAVDFYHKDEFREGRLVVAEWGEERIVRLEDDTGARTPLVMTVSDPCKHASARPRRVERPVHMLYTPFGDLLFMESKEDCPAVYRLNQAVHVPPLQSAMESRMAHKRNVTQHGHSIDVIYKEATALGSMALDSTGFGLYVTVRRQADSDDDDSVLLVHLSLDEDDEEDEEDMNADSKMEVNLTKAAYTVDPPRAMAIDEKGHIFFAVPTGVLVLDENGSTLGTLETPNPITSLTLGEDRYLYITTSSELMRIRVRHGPPKVPTNRVRKFKAKT